MPQRPVAPRPFFTLGVLYFFAFFFFFCILLVLPALLEVFTSMPFGPEQQQPAKEAARAALQGKGLLAFALALTSLIALAYANWLPGLRRH